MTQYGFVSDSRRLAQVRAVYTDDGEFFGVDAMRDPLRSRTNFYVSELDRTFYVNDLSLANGMTAEQVMDRLGKAIIAEIAKRPVSKSGLFTVRWDGGSLA